MQEFEPVNALGFGFYTCRLRCKAGLQLHRLAAKFSKETDLRATFITQLVFLLYEQFLKAQNPLADNSLVAYLY